MIHVLNFQKEAICIMKFRALIKEKRHIVTLAII